MFLCAAILCLLSQPLTAAAAEPAPPSALEEMTFRLLMQPIQNVVAGFYAPYLTITPTVAYYYGTRIIEIKDNTLVIEVTPYVGPHLGLGKDEISFTISNTGLVIVSGFRHLESYELPPHYQSSVKKPLP